ncbi:MAG TPA: EamA family transporter [Candidatus Fimivivens sp.]|nr:EamA family transporter [Candidatus Fimivivens sp.]
MFWIYLALIAAALQAVEAAIKKKLLREADTNVVIGTVSFLGASVLFFIAMYVHSGQVWHPGLSARFWEAMFFYAGLNIAASWYGYKALDLAEFTFLAPFMTLTSLTMAIPPIFLLGEFPSIASLSGIILVIAGTAVMTFRRKRKDKVCESEDERRRNNRKGLMYLLITAGCFTFTPTLGKVTIQESTPLFASFVVFMLIGLGFMIISVCIGKFGKLRSVLTEKGYRVTLVAILVTAVLTFIENASANTAMTMAPVATVMALKRTAPLFSFIIGITYFRERKDILKKLAGAVLMVAGAIIISIL